MPEMRDLPTPEVLLFDLPPKLFSDIYRFLMPLSSFFFGDVDFLLFDEYFTP